MNIKQRIKILIEFPPQQQFIDRHFSGVYKGNLLEVVISRLLLYEFCCFVFFKAHIMVLFLASSLVLWFSVAHNKPFFFLSLALCLFHFTFYILHTRLHGVWLYISFSLLYDRIWTFFDGCVQRFIVKVIQYPSSTITINVQPHKRLNAVKFAMHDMKISFDVAFIGSNSYKRNPQSHWKWWHCAKKIISNI